jgi:hypothetical protein
MSHSFGPLVLYVLAQTKAWVYVPPMNVGQVREGKIASNASVTQWSARASSRWLRKIA